MKNDMKRIEAIKPYQHKDSINFKTTPYTAWEKLGGATGKGFFPSRWLHGMAFRYEMPTLWRDEGTAKLMFVEPVSITFDTFPYYACNEVIPFIWDCWPQYYDRMEKWMRKHRIKTAIFTSRQEMEAMQQRLPEIVMIHCPEAVDTSLYSQGKNLRDRDIDLLEFGRSNAKIVGAEGVEGIKHVTTYQDGRYIFSNEELFDAMRNAKTTICLPRSMTHPETAQGIETLTQRYWEAMLSRIVIIGHAPKELTELTGYNPVVTLDMENAQEQIRDVIRNIEKYQDLADKNRVTALTNGDWKKRMDQLMTRLGELGYNIGRSN